MGAENLRFSLTLSDPQSLTPHTSQTKEPWLLSKWMHQWSQASLLQTGPLCTLSVGWKYCRGPWPVAVVGSGCVSLCAQAARLTSAPMLRHVTRGQVRHKMGTNAGNWRPLGFSLLLSLCVASSTLKRGKALLAPTWSRANTWACRWSQWCHVHRNIFKMHQGVKSMTHSCF